MLLEAKHLMSQHAEASIYVLTVNLVSFSYLERPSLVRSNMLILHRYGPRHAVLKINIGNSKPYQTLLFLCMCLYMSWVNGLARNDTWGNHDWLCICTHVMHMHLSKVDPYMKSVNKSGTHAIRWLLWCVLVGQVAKLVVMDRDNSSLVGSLSAMTAGWVYLHLKYPSYPYLKWWCRSCNRCAIRR